MIIYYKKDKEYATTITIFNAKTASSRHLLGNQIEDIFGQQFPFRVHHNKNSSLPEPPLIGRTYGG